jgi:hypothetical protein
MSPHPYFGETLEPVAQRTRLARDPHTHVGRVHYWRGMFPLCSGR